MELSFCYLHQLQYSSPRSGNCLWGMLRGCVIKNQWSKRRSVVLQLSWCNITMPILMELHRIHQNIRMQGSMRTAMPHFPAITTYYWGSAFPSAIQLTSINNIRRPSGPVNSALFYRCSFIVRSILCSSETQVRALEYGTNEIMCFYDFQIMYFIPSSSLMSARLLMEFLSSKLAWHFHPVGIGICSLEVKTRCCMKSNSCRLTRWILSILTLVLIILYK